MSADPPKKTPIAGHILTALVGLAMCASAGAKIAGVEAIVANLTSYGLADYVVLIGVIELVSAVLFVVPKTSSVGAFLVTGYFGGAIVAHLTIGDVAGIAPAVVLGLLAWGANYLRNRQMFESFSR
ncbi:MAG: DoxX family protein [Polyangiales bacterium]